MCLYRFENDRNKEYTTQTGIEFIFFCFFGVFYFFVHHQMVHFNHFIHIFLFVCLFLSPIKREEINYNNFGSYSIFRFVRIAFFFNCSLKKNKLGFFWDILSFHPKHVLRKEHIEWNVQFQPVYDNGFRVELAKII